jgi:hypothetical protein
MLNLTYTIQKKYSHHHLSIEEAIWMAEVVRLAFSDFNTDRGKLPCGFVADIGADLQIPKVVCRRSSSSLVHPAPKLPGLPQQLN